MAAYWSNYFRRGALIKRGYTKPTAESRLHGLEWERRTAAGGPWAGFGCMKEEDRVRTRLRGSLRQVEMGDICARLIEEDEVAWRCSYDLVLKIRDNSVVTML